MDRLTTYRKRRNSLSNNTTPLRTAGERRINQQLDSPCPAFSVSPLPQQVTFIDTENQQQMRSPSLCQITEINPSHIMEQQQQQDEEVVEQQQQQQQATSRSATPFVEEPNASNRVYDMAAELICLRIGLQEGEKDARSAVEAGWLTQLLGLFAGAAHAQARVAAGAMRRGAAAAQRREEELMLYMKQQVAAAAAAGEQRKEQTEVSEAAKFTEAVDSACNRLRVKIEKQHAEKHRLFLLRLMKLSGLDKEEYDYFCSASESAQVVSLSDIESALAANLTELRASALLFEAEEEKKQVADVANSPIAIQTEKQQVAVCDVTTETDPVEEEEVVVSAPDAAAAAVVEGGGDLTSMMCAAQAATALLQKAAVEEKLRRTTIQLQRAVHLLGRNQRQSSALFNWQRKIQSSKKNPVQINSWLAGGL